MAGANSIRAGRAYVETGVDNNQLSAGLRVAANKLKAFGSSLRTVGASLVGAGVTAAVPFALATQSFATFESAMARVQALTNASESDFASLSAEAKRLGATTVYSASEAAKAMGVFALAGYQTNDIIKATGPALQLAAAGQMDLAQAADISMKVMSGMGIATDDLGTTIDVLAKAMTTANTDLIMLGDAFKYVGPVARSAGMSLEETTAAIQVLSDAGIQADMAGTTLRGAILSLTSPSEEARKALKKMGVEVMDAKGDFRGLTNIIADMEVALKGLGSGERLQLIGDIFANRQATGIATLIDRGAGELKTKTASLGTAGQEGTSGRIAKTQLDTLYGAWKLLESAVEGVAIAVGEALMPAIREWAAIATDGLAVIHNIVKENKEWIPVIAKVAAGMIVAGGTLTAIGIGFAGVGIILGGLATGVSMVVGAFSAAGAVIAAVFSPIGLAIAGVGAAVAYLATQTSTFSVLGRIAKVTFGVLAIGAGVAAGSLYLLYEATVGAGQLIYDAMAWLANGFAYAFSDIIDVVAELTTSIMDGFSEIGRIITDVASVVAKPFLEAMSLIEDGVTSLFTGMQSTLSSMGDTFGKTWGGIINAISSGDFQAAGRVAWAGMEVIWLKGVNWLSGIWRGFTGYFVEAFHSATFEIAKTVNSVWGGLEKIWFESFNLIATAWGYLMDFMRKTFVSATAGFKIQWAAVQASVGAITVKEATQLGAEAGATASRDREAIDAERKAENDTIERNRQAIETRRVDAEGAMLDAQVMGKNARREARMRAEADEAEKLAEAEAELAKAIIDTLPLDRSMFESDGEMMLLKEKAPTKQSLADAGERATGMGVGGGSAGTFDANMLRFLAGTGNEDIMQKRQTEAAERAAERLQRLIDIARDNQNTYT